MCGRWQVCVSSAAGFCAGVKNINLSVLKGVSEVKLPPYILGNADSGGVLSAWLLNCYVEPIIRQFQSLLSF